MVCIGSPRAGEPRNVGLCTCVSWIMGNVAVMKERGVARRRKVADVHQFLVVLANTDLLVWRRIQLRDGYSLWDIHVAIQDAMGWQDYHLHEFTVVRPEGDRVERIGMPDEDFPEERPTITGWELKFFFTCWWLGGGGTLRVKTDRCRGPTDTTIGDHRH